MNFYGIPKLDLEFLCSDFKNMFLVAITGLLPGESPYTHNYYVLWFVNVETAILSPAFPTQLITKCRCVEISGHEVLTHRERNQLTEFGDVTGCELDNLPNSYLGHQWHVQKH